METIQSPFDLNRAIQQWRDHLGQSPAFRRENLDELEAHLRDSIATWQLRELSAEESFMVATKRAGGQVALGAEFEKINASGIWLDRAVWMLLGNLGIGTMSILVLHGSSVLLFLMLRLFNALPQSPRLTHGYIALIYISAYLLTFSGVLLAGWHLFKRHQNSATMWLVENFQSRARFAAISVLGILVIFLSRALGPMSTAKWFYSGPAYTEDLMLGLASGLSFAWLIQTLGFALLALWLARRRWSAKIAA